MPHLQYQYEFPLTYPFPMSSFMNACLRISCRARDPHCSRVGLAKRLKSRLTSVRTISHRADSSSDSLRIHSSTSGRQCSGIANKRDQFDFDTEDPGVDGLDV